MHKICMIMPYFGKWPAWMELYLQTCRYNPTINWIFFTDCQSPKNQMSNVQYVHMSRDKFAKYIRGTTGLTINMKRNMKLCDLRPAYGDVFAKYLEGYDFWGFGDIDVFYGDIRKFITESVTKKYDVISARPQHVAGHFTLFRNVDKLNKLYRNFPGYAQLCAWPWHLVVDESTFSHRLRILDQQGEINFLHKSMIEHDQRARPDGNKWTITWDQGTLMYQAKKNKELMYFHFMRSKKDKNFTCPRYKKNLKEFTISGNFYPPVKDGFKRKMRAWVISRIRSASWSWPTINQQRHSLTQKVAKKVHYLSLRALIISALTGKKARQR